MAKRKWTFEEIEVYRKEHGSLVYYNKEDANLFVPKIFSLGMGFNWGNPTMWVIVIAIAGFLIWSAISR